MSALRSILQGKAGPLDQAALELAQLEFPALEPDPYLDQLDRLAAGLVDLSAEGLISYGRELGFRGNESDYYDPRNSCLNAVLDRRTGIPITLSVVYREIAKRRNWQLDAIGLPGHFMLADGVRLIDAFHGRIYSRDQAIRMIRELSGVVLADEDPAFQPVTDRQIVLRMLNNLRAVYLRQNRMGKVARVLDWMREATNGEDRAALDRELKAARQIHSRLN